MINILNKEKIEHCYNLYWFFLAAFLLFQLISCSVQSSKSVQKPNILIAIADDASYPHMGAYGTDWVDTPAFDRVAEEGILFTRAYVPNPKCAPSRAIILTGRNSWQLEEAANMWPYFPQKFKVYTEALAEHGYFVGSTGKGWGPGIARTENGEVRNLAGQMFNEYMTEPPTSNISSNDYAKNFEAFLEARPEDKPFSFWFGAREPHRGYEYQSGIEKGEKSLSDIDFVPEYWPDDEKVRIDILDYAFEIEHFDYHLERMLGLLEEHQELENTIVIITSDNGMPFPRSKGNVYEISAHMPLAIMWPEGIKQPGRVVKDFVSFADFAPTFIELAGLEWDQTGMQSTAGRSLTDILFSDKEGQINPDRDHVLLGKERHAIGRPYDWGYPIRGIIRDNMLYIRNFENTRWPAGNPETGYPNTDGSPTKTFILDNRSTSGMYHYWQWNFGKRSGEELYNIAEDPGCIHNLANDPGYKKIKNKMNADLYKKLKEQEDPRMFGRGFIFDAYSYANQQTANFYHRYINLGEKIPTGWMNDSDFEKKTLPSQRN